ncbi:MAG: Hpt domain protein [Edaphobacter sp.]|nr:Hpt domain protein [Edaphobacter sp.]
MKKTSPDQISTQTKAQTKAPINDQIDDLLLQLWQKNLPTIRQRLELMDQFGSAAVSGSLEEHTRIEALNIAHKLAGSLGMYGYQKGTEVASKMERILKSPTPETLVTLRALAADLRKSLAAGL